MKSFLSFSALFVIITACNSDDPPKKGGDLAKTAAEIKQAAAEIEQATTEIEQATTQAETTVPASSATDREEEISQIKQHLEQLADVIDKAMSVLAKFSDVLESLGNEDVINGEAPFKEMQSSIKYMSIAVLKLDGFQRNFVDEIEPETDLQEAIQAILKITERLSQETLELEAAMALTQNFILSFNLYFTFDSSLKATFSSSTGSEVARDRCKTLYFNEALPGDSLKYSVSVDCIPLTPDPPHFECHCTYLTKDTQSKFYMKR